MGNHAYPCRALRAIRRVERLGVGPVHRHPRDADAAHHGAAVRQAGECPAEDAVAHAAAAGDPQAVQERQAAAQRRDDEVLQGERHQPARRLPAAGGAVAGLLGAVQRAARHRGLAARTGTEVRPDGPGRGERARGAYFRGVAGGQVPLPAPASDAVVSHSDLDLRAGQRRHDVHDHAAEPEARHDAADPVDPDNPAANMQKYMMYIAPFFALSGLYWQFGLVIYWVTTNVWTLGQQHIMFRNLPVVGSDGVSVAAGQPTPRSG